MVAPPPVDRRCGWPTCRARTGDGRVAEDDADVVEREPELVGDELGERRLVALAVVVQPDRHADLAGGIDAQAAES